MLAVFARTCSTAGLLACVVFSSLCNFREKHKAETKVWELHFWPQRAGIWAGHGHCSLSSVDFCWKTKRDFGSTRNPFLTQMFRHYWTINTPLSCAFLQEHLCLQTQMIMGYTLVLYRSACCHWELSMLRIYWYILEQRQVMSWMSGCGTSCSLTLEILAAAFQISLGVLVLMFWVEKLRSKLKEFSVSSKLRRHCWICW